MSNGDGGGTGLGDLLSGIGSIIDAVIADIIAVLKFLASILVAVFNFLVKLISALFKFNTDGELGLLDGIRKIWQFILLKVIGPIIALFKTIIGWLQHVLKPILDYLKKVRAWYDDYYKRVLRPLLTLITRIRQVLAFFKLFHVKWATVLDNFLASVQNRIVTNFNRLRGYTNYLLSWVQIFFDPRYLLRRVPYLAGAMRAVNALSWIFSGHGLGFFAGIVGGPGLDSLGTKSTKQTYTELQSNLLSGGGDVGAWRAQFADNLKSVQSEIGQG
jgi:hypothetical protein